MSATGESPVVVQIALDFVDLPRAIEVAREAVAGGVDWVEAGTPLIKAEGLQAVRELKAAFPEHLIFADLNMPRLDGRGLLLRVRSVLPGTPVIVLSARGSAELGAASLETMGAAGYFPKPVKVDDLLARIHDLIGH